MYRAGWGADHVKDALRGPAWDSAFQKAIEEGEDPPALALAQMEDQLRQHQVKVLLYNTQTVSPITTRVQQMAKSVGVPVVGVSETEPPRRAI